MTHLVFECSYLKTGPCFTILGDFLTSLIAVGGVMFLDFDGVLAFGGVMNGLVSGFAGSVDGGTGMLLDPSSTTGTCLANLSSAVSGFFAWASFAGSTGEMAVWWFTWK